MSKYLRPTFSNRPIYFTVCLAHRNSTLLTEEIELLRQAVRQTKDKHPFEICAWVTLPDHIHAIWDLPKGDRGYGVRWGMIKSKFSRNVLRKYGWPKSQVAIAENGCIRRVRGAHHSGVEDRCAPRTLRRSHVNRGELGIWQRRFWEHHIRNDRDLKSHIRYCWNNPVKHRLCKRPTDWPYSSIHRDVRNGVVEAEWTAPDLECGEP